MDESGRSSLQPSLLGLASYLQTDDTDRLVDALLQTWIAMTGRDAGDLDEDLKLCRRWFDPVAQGQRLRKELAQLPVLSPGVLDPGEPMTLTVAPGKRLITPEGRCALDLLRQMAVRRTFMVSESQLAYYDRKLAWLYRDWSRHRLQTVVDLLAGDTKPLQISAAGVVIALLVNRCTSEERGLIRYASGRERDVVDEAFFAAVKAFGGVLTPKGKQTKDAGRLISGWPLYEARRRLDGGLVLVDARAGSDGLVWIRPEAEANVIDVVTRDLTRGHRQRVTNIPFAVAFDALVSSLRESLPSLAAYGLVHERPKNTERLRQTFLAKLSYHLEAQA